MDQLDKLEAICIENWPDKHQMEFGYTKLTSVFQPVKYEDHLDRLIMHGTLSTLEGHIGAPKTHEYGNVNKKNNKNQLASM